MDFYLPIAEISVSIPFVLFISFFIGAISGLVGIGGGFMMTPFLIFYGINVQIVIPTQTAQIAAASLGSVITHGKNKNIDYKITGYLVLSGILGSVVGVKYYKLLLEEGYLELVTSLGYVIILGVVAAVTLNESIRAIRDYYKEKD